jgi:hypothetical protein
VSTRRPTEAAPSPSAAVYRRRRLVAVLIVLVIVAAVVLAIWQPWKSAAGGATPSPTRSARRFGDRP